MRKHLQILLVCIGFCLLAAELLPTDGPHKNETLCRPDLCPHTEEHLGCLSNNTYGKKCGSGVQVIHVNGGLKLGILARVNLLRNYIASGAGNLPAAGRMPTVGWDTTLQRLADLQARQCDENYRFCANTKKYRYVATTEIRGEIGQHTNVRHVILSRFLPKMFLDVLDCKMDSEHRLSFPSSLCVGHYVPLIEDHGNRMGCAIRVEAHKNNSVKPFQMKTKRIREDRSVNINFICHFSRANVNSQRHYEEAKEPTSKCVTGSNRMYSYLCSPEEVVDANKIGVASHYKHDFLIKWFIRWCGLRLGV
ncbi:hypothetical protein KR038_001286 [Drosophila bunnanda]|nr:hypothetical protein KR038_001286 [Drosophila bunnanda]